MEKQISILNLLASSLGRRDEIPNVELAKKITGTKNKKAVKELIENLANKNKDISGDCIKVVYEIAAIEPLLIADYAKEILPLLESKNNRMQWGAMTCLSAITQITPEEIYKSLPKIISAAEKGSVITKDHYVKILVKLASVKKYAKDAFPLLNEMLLKCADNQFPMYVENVMEVIDKTNKEVFLKTIKSRLKNLEKESAKKRVEKVIKKLESYR